MYVYKNILFLFYIFISFIVDRLSRLADLGGPDPLSLVAHVPFLRFLILREILAHIFDIYEWP